MREIFSSLFISMDGVVESPADWHLPYFDDEMGQEVEAAMSAADTLLLGRVTYAGFAATWPDRDDDDGADFMNNIPKVVVSTTLEKADWNNTTIVRDNVAERITELKNQDGGRILISGSPTLVRWLLSAGLLDTLHLLVHPIAVGRGARLLQDVEQPVPLRLVSSKPFGTGVVAMTYAPAET